MTEELFGPFRFQCRFFGSYYFSSGLTRQKYEESTESDASPPEFVVVPGEGDAFVTKHGGDVGHGREGDARNDQPSHRTYRV